MAHRGHNITVLENLNAGDLVEFDRGLYSHWAVYLGNGQVIHLAGDDNDGLNGNMNSGSVFTICGQRFKKAFVRIDDFWDVVLESKAIKNNSKDRKMTPCDVEEIIERAMGMIGEIGYNVLWSNCEHFTSYCRYGRHKSDQSDKFVTWATVGALAAGLLAFAIGSSSKKGAEKTQTA